VSAAAGALPEPVDAATVGPRSAQAVTDGGRKPLDATQVHTPGTTKGPARWGSCGFGNGAMLAR
jgi:hypothetical protein